MRERYFESLLHPHFVLVHLAGFVFGTHLAIASACAIYHHSRRTPLVQRVAPRLRPVDAPEAVTPLRRKSA